MKKFLWFAIISPIIAYVPLLSAGALPREVNIVVLPLFLLIGIGAGVYVLTHTKGTRRKRMVLLVLAAGVYLIEMLGILDLVLLFSGGRPVIMQSSGEGFADLATFVTWVLIVIPFTYIASLILVSISYRSQQPRITKK